MRIDKRRHLAYLKRKFSELNRVYLRELKFGKRSLQYIKDVSEVIQTLSREIRSLESDVGNRGFRRA